MGEPSTQIQTAKPHQRRSGYVLSPIDGSPLFFERESHLSHTVSSDASAKLGAVMTDGIGCDGFIWKYLRPDLRTDLDIVHWHYPGHGRSPAPHHSLNLQIADLADDLVAVMDETKTAKAVLFGHSMGVQVVLETYRRHPKRVAAMVLLCGMWENPLRTFRGNRSLEVVLPKLRSLVARAPGLFNTASRWLTPTRLAYALAKRLEINADLLDPNDFMPYLRGLSLIDVPLFLSMLSGAAEHSAEDVLPLVDIPTLIIGGERDGFTPPELSKQMADAIPNAELLIIEGGSHTAPIERPALVAHTVKTFLAQRL